MPGIKEMHLVRPGTYNSSSYTLYYKNRSELLSSECRINIFRGDKSQFQSQKTNSRSNFNQLRFKIYAHWGQAINCNSNLRPNGPCVNCNSKFTPTGAEQSTVIQKIRPLGPSNQLQLKSYAQWDHASTAIQIHAHWGRASTAIQNLRPMGPCINCDSKFTPTGAMHQL